MKARLLLAIVVLLLCASAWGAPPNKHQYILVKNRYLFQQPNASSPAPIADEVSHGGGHVDYEGWDRLLVTLPDNAVDAITKHVTTKYLQLVRSVSGPANAATVSDSAIAVTGPASSPAATHSKTLRPIAMTTSTWDSGTYAYDGAGNITGIGTDTFTYDALSRLHTTSIKGNTESYTYDPYGNLIQKTTTPAGGPPLIIDLPASTTTNRLNAQGYDTAGNLTGDSFETNTYDPFNMMRQKVLTTSAEYYLYNANDERIAVISNPCSIAYPPQNLPQNCSTALITVSGRDETGKVLRQMNLPYQRFSSSDAWLWLEDYIYRDGQLLAAERIAAEGGRRHFHLDHLGSPRLVTGPTGMSVAAHDYYPFGVEITSIHQETSAGLDREEPMKFTGHERDFNSGTSSENSSYNDYMHARFYSPTVGRFLSVDPVLETDAALKEPQRWNRYAYVMNNPMSHTDPTGKVVEIDAAADVRRLKAILTETMRRPTGRADVMAVINDPNHKLRMTSGMLTSPAQIQMNMQSHRSASITFGRTVPNGTVQLQPNGTGQFVVSGSTMTIDTNSVSQHHSDRSGVTTTAHEFDHVNDLRAGGVAQMLAGDTPSSAAGSSERHGQAVAAERPDMTAAQVRQIIDQLIQVRP